MRQRKFTVTNQFGERLVCVEARPSTRANEHLPIVILCHGFAYYKEEDGIFTEVASRLASKGYAVYYFDFSGCGESEGDYEKTSLTKLVADLKSVYEVVKKYDYVDAQNISLMGHSFGTNVVIASQLTSVKRLVLSGSFGNPREILSNLFQEHFSENGVSIRRRSGGGATTLGSQFWSDLKKYDIPELIRAYSCPILFLHGQKDGIVPIENMKSLVKAAKQPLEPVILDVSDHGLEPQREQAFEAIDDFFEVISK